MPDLSASVAACGSGYGQRLRPFVTYVAGAPEQVARVRACLHRRLGDHPAAEACILAVSELVTNAVRHTRSGHGGRIGIAYHLAGDLVVAAVADEGSPAHRPCLCGWPSDEDEHGRGLPLVERLSLRMGWVSLGAVGAYTWFVAGEPRTGLPYRLTPVLAVLEAVLFPDPCREPHRQAR